MALLAEVTRSLRAPSPGWTHVCARAVEVPMVERAMLDCERCGACCTNPRENVREGRVDYVPIELTSRLLTRRDLVRKYVAADPPGAPHMRLVHDGRCSALRGALGGKVRCDVYHLRPRACRTVQPGDGDCLQARATFAADVG